VLTKVVLGIATFALLYLVYAQGTVIVKQQRLIHQMMQDSNCNGTGGTYGTT
jgi:hypothetical protein